ncbi:hypothetical protein STANM309S_00672 [Streptomyces tanashiensis]
MCSAGLSPPQVCRSFAPGSLAGGEAHAAGALPLGGPPPRTRPRAARVQHGHAGPARAAPPHLDGERGLLRADHPEGHGPDPPGHRHRGPDLRRALPGPRDPRALRAPGPGPSPQRPRHAGLRPPARRERPALLRRQPDGRLRSRHLADLRVHQPAAPRLALVTTTTPTTWRPSTSTGGSPAPICSPTPSNSAFRCRRAGTTYPSRSATPASTSTGSWRTRWPTATAPPSSPTAPPLPPSRSRPASTASVCSTAPTCASSR